MNRRFLMALAASALFGLVAILIFQKILQNTMDGVGHRDQTQIVYAATKIPAGTTIAQNQIKLEFQGSQALPEGPLLNVQEAVGKIAQVDIEANLPITTKNTTSSDKAGTLVNLRPGMRAISIRVDEATSVSGFTQPGSVVDVGAVLTPSQNSRPVSKVIVQNLRVLANGRDTQIKTEGQARSGNTVTLEVTPAQAGMLALAMREGSLYLILRHPTDKTNEPIVPVMMGGMVDDDKTSVPRATITPQPTPQIYPPWGGYPPLTPRPSPTPTPSPGIKMAQVRVIAGDKPSEVLVRQ